MKENNESIEIKTRPDCIINGVEIDLVIIDEATEPPKDSYACQSHMYRRFVEVPNESR